MDPVTIEYRVKFGEERIEAFQFKLDGSTFDLIKETVRAPAEWTDLLFRQCPHCPLDIWKHSHCPMALELQGIVERFQDTHSIDRVELEVITEERRVIQALDIQRAIASMLDLVLPTCGCPRTEHLKPLARFHLPLASEEETVFRVTGMYLLAQYFLGQVSLKSRMSFDGLSTIFRDLHTLNKSMTSRLQIATRSDSVKNAFALIDVYSVLVPVLVEDKLVEMRGFFSSYLPEAVSSPVPTIHLDQAKAFKLDLVPLDREVEKPREAPAWLKGGDWSNESAPTKVKEKGKAPGEKVSVADLILSKSDVKLELAPVARKKEEKGEESKDSKGRGGSPGKARD